MRVRLQSLLSVRDVRAVRLSLLVPETYKQLYVRMQYGEKGVMVMGACEASSGLTGGPFSPGKPVGP